MYEKNEKGIVINKDDNELQKYREKVENHRKNTAITDKLHQIQLEIRDIKQMLIEIKETIK